MTYLLFFSLIYGIVYCRKMIFFFPKDTRRVFFSSSTSLSSTWTFTKNSHGYVSLRKYKVTDSVCVCSGKKIQCREKLGTREYWEKKIDQLLSMFYVVKMKQGFGSHWAREIIIMRDSVWFFKPNENCNFSNTAKSHSSEIKVLGKLMNIKIEPRSNWKFSFPFWIQNLTSE